jgi:hypothetical protein
MSKFKRYLKRFGTDAAGYGLILLGLALGWLPGPGGIPLILAGLGLLSVHNHWAKRILLYLQENGIKMLDYVFPDKPWAKLLHDLLAIGLLIGASYLLMFNRTTITIGIAIGLIALAIADILINRNRLTKLKNK